MPDLMPWHKNWLVNIEYNRVDFVKEGANSPAFIKLFKSKGGNTMDLEEILKSMKPEHAEVIRKALAQSKTDADEAVAKAKADAETEIAKAKAELTPPPAPGASEEEILKTVKDPAVRALLETSIAKTKAAEAVAKKLKDEQDEKDAIAKAKEVPNLGAEEATMTSVYKKLKSADPALCDEVFGIFKSASALISTGAVFTEIGKGAGNHETAASEDAAWSKIEAAADAIAKSTNVSKSAAITQAIEENPRLYADYLKAQQGL